MRPFSLGSGDDEARIDKNPEMMREGRLSEIEVIEKLAGAQLAARKDMEYPRPGFVGHGLEQSRAPFEIDFHHAPI